MLVTDTPAVPLTEPLVAVTVAGPAAKALNKPLPLTVPTVVLLDVQVRVAAIGFPNWSRVVAVNCRVLPTITLAEDGLRVIVVRTGVADTTVAVVEPLTAPLVAVTVAEPTARALNKPLPLTVPTVVLLDVQVRVAAIGFPNWSKGEAVNWWVAPTATTAGVRLIAVRTGVAAKAAGTNPNDKPTIITAPNADKSVLFLI